MNEDQWLRKIWGVRLGLAGIRALGLEPRPAGKPVLTGACAACAPKAACLAAGQMAQRVRDLLAAFGREEHIEIKEDAACVAGTAPAVTVTSPTAEPGRMSRRGLFTALLGGLTAPLDPTAAAPGGGFVLLDGTDEMPRGQLPVRVPAQRGRLLAVLRSLETPADGAEAGAAAGLWAQFGLTEACNGCQMCAFFCPTGALKAVTQDGRNGSAGSRSR